MKISFFKRCFAAAALSAAFLWGGLAADAAPAAAGFTVTPSSSKATAGDSITYTITYTEGDMDVAGVLFTLKVPDGCTFDSAAAGTGRSGNELSYSLAGDELRLMFLDNGAGNTPVHVGEEVLRFAVTVSTPGEKAFQPVGSADVSCIQGSTAHSVEGNVLVNSLTVQGSAANPPAPKADSGQTVFSEAGGSAATVKTPATVHSPAGPTPTPVALPSAGNSQAAETPPPAEVTPQEAPHNAAAAPAESVAGESAPAPAPAQKTSRSILPVVFAVVLAVVAAGVWLTIRHRK